MADSKRNSLNKQPSLSYIEQSLKIIPAPPQEPVTIYRGPKLADSKLSKADIEIANRLHNLRKRDVAIPTEEEMAKRLAQLKGLPDEHFQKRTTPFYQPSDNRTDTEKCDDLLNQALSEVNLDNKVSSKETKDIELRLSKLKGRGSCDSSAMETHSEGSRPAHSYGDMTIPPGPDAMDVDEIEKLLKEAQSETLTATSALNSISTDTEIRAAMKKVRKKKKKPVGCDDDDTSSGEKYSHDSDSDCGGVHKQSKPASSGGGGGGGGLAASSHPTKGSEEDAAEVDRIVKMYTAKAERKKKKKRLVKKLQQYPPKKSNVHSDSSTCSASLDSISDLQMSTSDTDKLSSSDSD